MKLSFNNIDESFSRVKESPTWNNHLNEELRMHKIHVYPAKFPSFLISKALNYARKNKVKVDSIGDIFCGCGTTALEAKRHNKNFWGCDINPVATLIAKVKRGNYDCVHLVNYYDRILIQFNESNPDLPEWLVDNDRIRYWFHDGQIRELNKLLTAINNCTPNDNYREFFLVAFSNILKKNLKVAY